jgi:hypothetical protein
LTVTDELVASIFAETMYPNHRISGVRRHFSPGLGGGNRG